jgi:hypothetical protein
MSEGKTNVAASHEIILLMVPLHKKVIFDPHVVCLSLTLLFRLIRMASYTVALTRAMDVSRMSE